MVVQSGDNGIVRIFRCEKVLRIGSSRGREKKERRPKKQLLCYYATVTYRPYVHSHGFFLCFYYVTDILKFYNLSLIIIN